MESEVNITPNTRNLVSVMIFSSVFIRTILLMASDIVSEIKYVVHNQPYLQLLTIYVKVSLFKWLVEKISIQHLTTVAGE